MIRRVLILQTLPRPLVFSPNNALITLARHLDRGRFELRVAVPRPGLITKALSEEGVGILTIPGLRTYRRHDAVWRLPVVSLRIAAAARKWGARLLLANHAELAPFAHVAARLCGLPWICFLRQADRSPRYYHKYRVARADAVAAVSEAALRGYRTYLQGNGLPSNPLTVVPTGIELPDLADASAGPPPLPPGWPLSSRIVGTVGLREVKRPEVLLEILARAAGDSPDLRGLFVGALEKERRERLESLARDRGILDRVCFAGQQREMTPWYRALHVYAHTSRSEGFPKAALEAMGHGLPVVAFRVGGLPEAVVDQETGFLCEPDDLEAFAGRLGLLLSDPVRARALGEAGRRRVRDRFSPEAMARGFMELFERVVAEGRRTDPSVGGGASRARGSSAPMAR